MEAERDSNWQLPFINVVLGRLRVCSYAADDATDASGGSASAAASQPVGVSGSKQRAMVDAQNELKRFLQKMVIDRSPLQQSKKMGCLFVIVHLFKVYFRLQSLKLCTFLMRMVPQLPPLTSYPVAQRVAYQYYLGRLLVFEEKYDEAESALSDALAHCHRSAVSNKRRILRFLIPLRLLRGRAPQDDYYPNMAFLNTLPSSPPSIVAPWYCSMPSWHDIKQHLFD